ncbi:hypothetical protein [Kineosporia sp. R_H_3]|uniref:hypothetical protein n=1 Tax=Kineosporia sp. R_H_3 TaxID=1961848 RepID=UPI000B4A65D2|nr:hypothetical protein [Kineosporia sp. R_H_3]
MSTTWTPAEEEAVRSALAVGQEAMDVGAVPWSSLERRRSAATRRHRTAVGLGVAGAIVAGLVGQGLLTGSVNGFVSPTAGSPFVPAYDGRTVGSLAADTAFLDGLRQRIADNRAVLPAGTDPSVVEVALATDVAGARLALARMPGRDGWVWVTGPQGAPVSGMDLGNWCVGDDVCWLRYGLGWTSYVDTKPDGSSQLVGARGDGAVVATEPGSRVVLRGGNDVTADGVLRPLQVAAEERWPGVFVGPLTVPPVRIDVAVTPPGGRTVRTWDASGSGLAPDEWWDVASASASRGRGVRGFSDLGDVRGDLVMAAARAAGAATGDGTRSRVVWADQNADGTVARAVLAFGTVSGGWLRVAVERVVEGGGFRLAAYGPAPVARDGLDGTGAAWRSVVGTAVVVGPAQARSFRWVDRDDRPLGGRRALDGDAAADGEPVPEGAVAVTFEGADGAALGRAALVGAWPDDKVLS